MKMNAKKKGPSLPLKGPKELKEDVIDTGQCTTCGLCLGLCPYLDERGENVAFLSDCRGDQGRCFALCPRTDTDLESLRNIYFPNETTDPVLGPYQSIWMARAVDNSIRGKGQYGATITALTLFGLETDRLDAALLTRWPSNSQEPFLPEPVVAKTPEQVLAAAGSKYTACPTLKVLDKTIREEAERLLVVGRPCQVLALRKRTQIDDPTFPKERIALIIGLFCMWSLSYREFRQMIGPLLRPGKLHRMDVPKGRFIVESDEGPLDLPHDSVRALSRQACQSCYDFTSELADLSVGSTEWKDDWNTLIIRSDAGQAFLEAAAEQGRLEIKPLPEERTALLREASFNKKQRVLECLEQRARQEGKKSYLQISKKERDFFSGTDKK